MELLAKRVKLNFLFKLSYLSPNFAQTLGYHNPASNINPALNDLNWHSLELRHKIVRLTTMYKIVSTLSTLHAHPVLHALTIAVSLETFCNSNMYL